MTDKKGPDKPGKPSPDGGGKTYTIASGKGRVTLGISGLGPKDKVLLELEQVCGGEDIPEGSFRGGGEDIAGADGRPIKPSNPTTASASGAPAPPVEPTKPADENEEAKRQKLEKEEAERQKAEADRVAREDKKLEDERKEREARLARAAAHRKDELDRENANRAHVERMVDKADNRWWRYILAIIIGAGIVWASWILFVCSDCMADRIGDPRQNEFPIIEDGDPEVLEDGDETPDPPDHELVVEQLAEEPPTFGEYQPADPELTLRILAYLTEREHQNFRFHPGDSLDGENKYLMMAAQTATLIQSGKGVRVVQGEPHVYTTSYNQANQLSEAGRMAWEVGQRAKYTSPYQNEKSFDWWVNNAVQAVPSSSETDFSRSVKETLEQLMEKIREEKIPSVNGRVIFAVNHTSKASDVRRTTRKKSTSPPTRSRSNAIVPANFYQNPVPGSHWDNNHWDGKSYAVDMIADKGTPVYASANGRVIRSGWGNKKSGKRVTIRDQFADNFYGHLDKIYVKKGQNVRQGQLIGRVGHTGSAEASAPHLHYEVLVRRVNNFPRPWLKWTQKQRRT